MAWFLNWWRGFWTSKEVALLTAENERLRETNQVLEEEVLALRKENRAMVNTMLGQAGVAPLPPVEEEKPKKIERVRHLTLHQQRRADENAHWRSEIAEAKKIKVVVDDRLAKKA